MAGALDAEMQMPNWRPDIVGFIPHYGNEESIQALRDYIRLKPLLTDGSLFEGYICKRFKRSHTFDFDKAAK